MFYIVIFVLLMLYALVRWAAMRLSPVLLFGGGLFMALRVDVLTGALLLFSSALILLVSHITAGDRLPLWNYQTRGSVPDASPDRDGERR